MAAGNTYTPIATTTLGSAAASYTFSSIPSTYTDLVLVFNGQQSASSNIYVQMNGDTATNYSDTFLYGNGTTAASTRDSTVAQISIGSSGLVNQDTVATSHFMNYANTTTNKTTITRSNTPAYMTLAYVGLWRSTAAINALKIFAMTGNLNAGSTFTLYGILAA